MFIMQEVGRGGGVQEVPNYTIMIKGKNEILNWEKW